MSIPPSGIHSQTDQFTESAYGALLGRQQQLHDETLAILAHNRKRRQFWEVLETLATIAGLLAMFSLGAWIGPVSKLVLNFPSPAN